MLMTILLLALLFTLSLFYSLSSFPRKRIAAWLQSFFVKTPPVVAPQPAVSQKKVKGSIQNKAELKSIFATFDRNEDGYITKQELTDSLKNIGMLLGENDVADMVSKVDSNGDGLIDFDEFCELFGSIMVTQEEIGGEHGGEESGEGGDGEADLREAFNVFDGDSDGLITVEELGLVLSSLGFKEGNRLEACKEMIRRIDMDGDGMVNFDEFKRMMKSGGNLVPVS